MSQESLRYAGQGWVWHHRARRQRMASAHRHADLEVNLCVEGRAAYLVDGVRTTLTSGSLLFLHPDEHHLLIEESADFRMWLAVWRPALVQTLARQGLDADAARARCPVVELRQVGPTACTRLARLFADVTAVEGPAAESGCAYLLWRCRAAYAEAADQACSAAHPAVVAAAEALHAEPGIALVELAHHVGLSADRLGRIFHDSTGITLVDYRCRLRLDRVCAAWASGADLLRLALDAGFGSYSAFHRAFLRRYGQPPGEYLRQASVDDRVIQPRRRRRSPTDAANG